LGLATVPLASLRAADTETSAEQLLGSWKVVSFTATTGEKVGNPLGEHPGGFIGFSSNRFWVMLIDSTRRAPATAALTDAEAVALMKSSGAYTGKYVADPVLTPDGIKITIHVDAAVNQALVGTDRVFFMRVDGNNLTVVSPSVLLPTTGVISAVHLEFTKDN
jgi:hypothetical protein